MAVSPADLVQRQHNYAIVDEVDSVLIDDARTPLIISGPVPKGDVQMFEEFQPLVQSLYEVQRKQATELLSEARHKLAEAQKNANIKSFSRSSRRRDSLPSIVHSRHCQRTRPSLNTSLRKVSRLVC